MHEYDVVVIGGAFSGSAFGILLKRALPSARVLVVESRTEFDRKVGESTSDVAGCFLTKVLREHAHLHRHHLPKQGLRLWFTTPENQDLTRCAEMGSHFQVRLATFQIDRAVLDEHLLETACTSGCELWRPARVKSADLPGAGANVLEIEHQGRLETVKAKWVIDASGKAAFLARKMGTLQNLDRHPTNSMWVRFANVRDLDSWEVVKDRPAWADAVRCPRQTATNHLSGRGWWCWIIPLKNGDVSAGLTWDPRLFTPPQGGSIPERLKQHLCAHPVGREMFENATPVDGDARAYSHLPYYSTKVMGDGWAIIGDAAGFMDPLYSQGLDYCSHTAYAVHTIVKTSLMGQCVKADIADYQERFLVSYMRWFEALYEGKYHYIGDADLMWAAFLLDLSTYFMGPVRLVYDHTDFEFNRLPYHGPAGAFFASFMKFYNGRLRVIGDKRWAAGTYGKNNLDRLLTLKQGFAPNTKMVSVLFQGIRVWLRAEWGALFLPSPSAAAAPATARPVPAAE